MGIDCGSVSLNLVILGGPFPAPKSLYLRTRGRPLQTLVEALEELRHECGFNLELAGAMVTGSGREMLSQALQLPAVNEITAHATGAFHINPHIRTIIEIGGQDSKFIRIEPPRCGRTPIIAAFRMNEICAAGTGAFLDEQAARLGIPVEDYEQIALRSAAPARIAGRCAVFAKTDMIHQAQEGTPLDDILLGVAFALVRNYVATLIRGEALAPLVSLQGGVMANGAVVRAFRDLLGLGEEHIVIPPYYDVLGALGGAVICRGKTDNQTAALDDLRDRASGWSPPGAARSSGPLLRPENEPARGMQTGKYSAAPVPPVVMGLDVGSVSVKGVIADGKGAILFEDYRLSQGRPLEALQEVIDALTCQCPTIEVVAVTGSGRLLAGRLLGAEVIVNEITAQARAAIEYDPSADTVVEIGGQDSKWIALHDGSLTDFEMNRVCAAGTGSFLMEQANRLGLEMGEEFSETAFASSGPSDLGTRCTVFMESDIVHHQNNGACREDLAAGVSTSIVRNYLERVANHKPLGNKIIFLGGVAANSAVRSAFEKETGRIFESPAFFRVSGALGAALKALDFVGSGAVKPSPRRGPWPRILGIPKKRFSCRGCSNNCAVDSYSLENRRFYHGGRCDRWELGEGKRAAHDSPDLFKVRTDALEALAVEGEDGREAESAGLGKRPIMGMVRSPHFYEWFPLWQVFFRELGLATKIAPAVSRDQFEQGTRHLQVEACLPVKALAGQIQDLVNSGIRTLFHPAILSEEPVPGGTRAQEHCPYVQVSSQFFRGAFDLEWIEPVISYQLDPDAFRQEHLRVAERLGFDATRGGEAFRRGLAEADAFRERMYRHGQLFLDSLAQGDRAVVVLGKPYHTSDPFLNMDLGGLFRRLGVKAIPGDLIPLENLPTRSAIAWKYQLRMIALARLIAQDARLSPVMITFFGCGPDPFTMRHIRESLKGKPLLILEMDEHSSRAGIMTRLEAFLDRVDRNKAGRGAGDVNSLSKIAPRGPSPQPSPGGRGRRQDSRSQEGRAGILTDGSTQDADPLSLRERVLGHDSTKDEIPLSLRERDRVRESHSNGNVAAPSVTLDESAPATASARHQPRESGRGRRVDSVYVPYFGDHSYAFAAAARSVEIEASVLTPPDEESAGLGRPHLMGGECHPYALILGDYLRLAGDLASEKARRSIFLVPGYSACRLGQYPIYMEKIRKECGHSMRVIADLSQALTAFGLSRKHRETVQLRIWEGLTAFDLLMKAFLQVRAVCADPRAAESVYMAARQALFESLSRGNPEEVLDNALQELASLPTGQADERPIVAVTGDYYTRIVDFANNGVYREIERLGGTVWSPPTFSDGLKVFYLQEAVEGCNPAVSEEFSSSGSFYASLVLSELRLRESLTARNALAAPLDPFGARLRRSVARHLDPRFPPGIAAPLATVLQQVELGAAGVLNLITLNCSYGTVVTAALSRVLRERGGVPMLTLVYDGLKKTNEKTRLEAFMEQVRDRLDGTRAMRGSH